MQIKARYYDGKTSARKDVLLSFDDAGFLMIQGEDVNKHFKIKQVKFPAHVGNAKYNFSLPDNSSCEVENYHAIKSAITPYLNSTVHHHIHLLENKLRYAAIASVIVILFLWGFIEYALPTMAKHVANQIPLSIETTLGEQALQVFDKTMFTESEIPQEKQAELISKFKHVANTDGIKILFRKSNSIGANAFALPSGIIVFTDEMVELAEDDKELIGVFAHELGHVRKRHVMRHILEDSVTVVLLVMLTGDIGSASSVAASIPTILIQTKHSRDFESEADQFGKDILLENNISPSHLANLLERLSSKHENVNIPDFLSSHPNSDNRILKLRSAE